MQAAAVVVDTMVVSALLNEARNPGKAKLFRALVGESPIVVSFVTVTELRYGAFRAGWGDLRCRALERDLGRLIVVQPDDDLMQRCAELRATSAANGHPLGQKAHESDRWIAATALHLRAELVSDDGVFRNVPGLVVRRTM